MDPFLGQVLLFAGNFAPRGWALCEGQIISINENQALYSILGTTYGGDGRTTFALPDLRGRAPLSPGNGPGLPVYNQGQKGGSTTTTLETRNLPAAQVAIYASDDEGTLEEPTAGVAAIPNNDSSIYTSSGTESLKHGNIIGAASIPFNNQPPYLAINYIIALQGVFPSRS